MNNSHKGVWAALVIIVLVVLAIALVYAFSGGSQQSASQPQTATTQNIQAVFSCDAGKSINAVFMNATTSTTTGNSVQLSLSDGRQMTLPQVISADAARSMLTPTRVSFSGTSATKQLIWENGTTTFTDCLTSRSQYTKTTTRVLARAVFVECRDPFRRAFVTAPIWIFLPNVWCQRAPEHDRRAQKSDQEGENDPDAEQVLVRGQSNRGINVSGRADKDHEHPDQ